MTLSDLARRLNRLAGAGHRHLPPLLLMTDSRRLPDPEAALPHLTAGDGVVFRDYERSDRHALGERLAARCREMGLVFLVAGDADLAMVLKADGLHLPESMARDWLDHHARPTAPGRILTVASHGAEGLELAARLEADAALLSPVFATQSHPETPALGVDRFGALCAGARLPVYGLGGITQDNAGRLLGSGCCGIAAIGGVVPG